MDDNCFNRSDVAHGIRRKVEEHCYIVGMHEQEEQGLCLLAGSRYYLFLVNMSFRLKTVVDEGKLVCCLKVL